MATSERLASERENRQKEREEIARQCEEAALVIDGKYPIASRILLYEAEGWRREAER